MTKTIILLIVASALVALIAPSARAQLTASKAFATAPQSVFPLLDSSKRLDMIDYYNSNLATPTQNRLDGQSRIVALTDKVLKVEMTPSSTYDIVILPAAASDSVIALISTMATPTPDSNISFYDRSWKPLAADKLFKKPLLDDWLTDAGKKNRAEVESMLPFLLVSYTWDPSANTLTLSNNSAQFLSEDIYSIIAPYMKRTLQYVWDGRAFKQQQ